MIPILLKGHERSITYVTYNEDGDLLFTCSKDNRPTVWWSTTGERLGTYEGHGGAVWTCSVTRDSHFLLTGSADNSAALWRVDNGERLFVWKHHGPVRVVAWADGEKQFLTVTDTFAAKPCQINIFDFAEDRSQQSDTPRLVIKDPDNDRIKITSAAWLPLNKGIITTNEKGNIRVYDPNTGKCTKTVKAHDAVITSMSFNKEKTLMITSSHDQTAKVWDVKTLETLKTYTTNTPLNACAISPLKEHVIVGGGQEARDVTTTAAGAGKFETRFFHMVFENELGRVKGHFGPVNTLAFHPNGRSYVSGAEDGYVRLHHFDPEYFQLGEEENLDAEAVNKAIEMGLGRLEDKSGDDEKELNKIPYELVKPAVEAARAKQSKKGAKTN